MATWYKTGTIDVTNGSTIVTGTGTAFAANVQIGDALHAPDGNVYEITGVVSDTSLTIASNYLGSTAVTQTYTAQPTRGWTKRVLDELDTSNTDVTTMLAGPGAGKFPDGTLAQPGMRFSADEDTGVRRVGSNAVALVAGGADKLSVTGNVASGDAVQANEKDSTVGRLMKVGAFGLGGDGSLTLSNLDDTTVRPGFYSYTPSTTGTKPSGATSYGFVVVSRQAVQGVLQILYNSNTGYFTRTSSSGTWASWVEAVSFDSAGDLSIDGGTLFVDASTNRVGVGTIAPEQALSVNGSIALSGGYRQMQNTGDANGLGLLGGAATTTGASMALYGGSHATQPGNVYLTYGGAGPTIGNLIFRFHNGTGFSEAARIDSAGNVGIGVSSSSSRMNVQSAASQSVIYSNNTNASYAKTNFYANATRAANPAYNFFSAYSGNFGDLEFKLSGDGNGTCDGSWTGGGADYAEYFEWVDGNPMAEDRRGISVVLEGDQIREAVAGEASIGVISGNPSVVGDAAAFRWKGKYLRDDFGSAVMEDYEAVSWAETVTESITETEQATEVQEDTETVVTIIDGAAVQKVVTKTREVPLFDEYPLTDATGNDLGIHREPRMVEVTRETTKEVEHSYAMDEVPADITVPEDAARVTQQRRKMNPDYVEGTDYTPREDRPEWDTVGLMGKLRLRTGQATGVGWVKMRDVSADVEEWLVR